MKNMIITHNGSVENIPTIPDNVKAIYKTVWEISQKKVLNLAADRGAFICQSQSLNVHLKVPTLGQLSSMHFYGWKKGLKTGMYYLRTRPAASAIRFTVDQSLLKEVKQQKTDATDAKVAKVPTNGIFASIASSSSSSSTAVPVAPSTPVEPVVAKQEPTALVLPATPSALQASSSSSPSDAPTDTASLTLDEKTRKAAEADPEFAAALQRQRDRELEDAKLQCSLGCFDP